MEENLNYDQNKPYVSVLLPVYNGGKYLKYSIESILNQTYTNLELIIINDCSTDDSEGIILNYNDVRIRYFKNEVNLQLIATLNKGLSLVRGKYIIRIDQDDIALAQRIEKQVYFMDSNPEYILSGTKVQLIDENGDFLDVLSYHQENEDVKFGLCFYCPFVHPSVIIRSSTLVENDLSFDANYIHAEDYAFWIQLSNYGLFNNSNEILTLYRIHSNQTSQIHVELQKSQMCRIQNEYKKNVLLDYSSNDLDLIFSDTKTPVYNQLVVLKKFYDDTRFNGEYKKRYIIKKIKKTVLESSNLSLKTILLLFFSKEFYFMSFSFRQFVACCAKVLK